MLLFGFPCVLWIFGLIQFAGVAFLVELHLSARRLPGNCPARRSQAAFFAMLLMLGLKIIWLMAHGWAEWVIGCPTLAVMILGATFDSGRQIRVAC